MSIEAEQTQMSKSKPEEPRGWDHLRKQLHREATASFGGGNAALVKLGLYKHSIIAPVLRQLAYDPDLNGEFLQSIFDDGSQPTPFPCGQLADRSFTYEPKVNDSYPSEFHLGLMSLRHPEMDYLVDFYIVRNRDVYDHDSTAEVEEHAFNESVKLLRFLIAQTSKEWIYQASENNLTPNLFEPAFPDLCPYEGTIRIDQESSCVASGDLGVMMCVKRSRAGDSDNVFGKHIIRLKQEWLPQLGSSSRFEVADLFQRTRVSPELADEISQRIRNTEQFASDNELLSIGIIEIDVVRVVFNDDFDGVPTKDSDLTAIVTETESQQDFIAHISGLGRGQLRPGERCRVHLSRQNKNELWVSFEQVRTSYSEGKIVPQAALLAQLIDDSEEVYGWLFRLEPGINARLLKNKGCDDEILKRLGDAKIGDTLELTVLENESENIELSSSSVYEAARTVFTTGDPVVGKLMEKTNYSDRSFSGCVVQLLPGREGFLSLRDICQHRDLSLAILSSWRKGSRVPVVIKEDKNQNKLVLELDWRPIGPNNAIVGYVSGFLESKNQHFQYAGVFVKISPKTDGFLHHSEMKGLDFGGLKFGSKLKVRIASEINTGRVRRYSLELA